MSARFELRGEPGRELDSLVPGHVMDVISQVDGQISVAAFLSLLDERGLEFAWREAGDGDG